MLYYTYILKSQKTSEYYIGHTDDINLRVIRHNSNGVLSTEGRGPWDIFYFEIFNNRSDAFKREKQIKQWKSRKAIERLKFSNKIEDPRFR